MAEDLLPSVAAMLADNGAPTAPLAEFIAAYEQDDNIWWRISCGHHMNLFDAAVEAIAAAGLVREPAPEARRETHTHKPEYSRGGIVTSNSGESGENSVLISLDPNEKLVRSDGSVWAQNDGKWVMVSPPGWANRYR